MWYLVGFTSEYTLQIYNFYNFYTYIFRDIIDQSYVSTSVKSEVLHLIKNGGSILLVYSIVVQKKSFDVVKTGFFCSDY